MKIAQKTVVSLNYTLKNGDGMVLDSSEGREPLVYLQGVGALISGLEKELEGKEKGTKLNAVIPPAEAYGERREDLVRVVSKDGFQGDEELFEGMQVQVDAGEGPMIASVSKIEGNDVTLDMNHPLADMTLHFDVEVLDVREATEEEINHGHVHAPDGHDH